jgi:hypothetical protein
VEAAAVDLVARVQAATAQARELAAVVRLPNRNYRYRMAQVTPLQLAQAGRAQLVVVRGLPALILFLVLLRQPAVVLELMAMEETAARAAAQSLPQLEVEQQGKATMERKDTITALEMLRAAGVVEQAQLV